MPQVRLGHVRTADGEHKDTIWECERAFAHKYKQEWNSKEVWLTGSAFGDPKVRRLSSEEVTKLRAGQCPVCP